MRAVAFCLVIAVILAPSVQGQGEVRDAGKVNKILPQGTFSTPDLEPGKPGELSFDVHNPYNISISNVDLNVSIYRYAEQDVSLPVDSSWQWEYPRFQNAVGTGREIHFIYSSLPSNGTERARATVLTSTDMPHGGLFTQGAYLIRFWLTFTHDVSQVRIASPGHWTKVQFMAATQEGERCVYSHCVGQVNLSRLGGIDGILPDTAFGVKDRLPTWPMYLLLAGVFLFAALAFLYYAEENPSVYPKTARAFAEMKGKMARLFRPRGKAKTPRT